MKAKIFFLFLALSLTPLCLKAQPFGQLVRKFKIVSNQSGNTCLNNNYLFYGNFHNNLTDTIFIYSLATGMMVGSQKVTVNGSSGGYGIKATFNRMYLGSDLFTLKSYDISNILNWTLLQTISGLDQGFLRGMMSNDSTLIAWGGHWAQTYQFFDISSGSLVTQCKVNTNGNNYNADRYMNYIYVENGYSGDSRVDINNLTSCTVSAFGGTCGGCPHMTSSGFIVFGPRTSSCDPQRIEIYNQSNVLTGSLNGTSYSPALCLPDNYVLVSNSGINKQVLYDIYDGTFNHPVDTLFNNTLGGYLFNNNYILRFINDSCEIYTRTTSAVQATNVTFSNILTTQFTVNWTDGNGSKRAVFIKHDTIGTALPVDNSTYIANTVFGSGTSIGASGWYCVFNGIEHPSGVTVTNLLPNTKYRVMVCEYNGAAGSEIYNRSSTGNNPKNQQAGTLHRWYASPAGSDTLGSGTLENPFKTIQHTILSAASNDTIVALTGLYNEKVDFLGKKLILGSLYLLNHDTLYIGNTIISGLNINNSDPGVRMEGTGGPNSILTGLTIDHMFGSFGGALRTNGGTARYVRIKNASSNGEGSAFYGSGSLEHCVITNCTSGDRGVVAIVGNVSIHSTEFYNNSGIAIYSWGNHITIDNSVFANNSGSKAGAIYMTRGGVVNLINCALFNNASDSNTAIYITSENGGNGSTLKMLNCIIWDTYTSSHPVYMGQPIAFGPATGTQHLYLSNNNIKNGSSGISGSVSYQVNQNTGLLTTDPYFISANALNFKLSDNSPAIGTGAVFSVLNQDTLRAPVSDIILSIRPSPLGSNPDLGAYENILGIPRIYPSQQAKNITFSNVLTTQLTMDWTNGNGTNRVVFIKQDSVGTAMPSNNVFYTANEAFGSGTQIGTTGWYCVFNGVDHPSGLTVTNLQLSTKYRLMVCEYYGIAGAEQFNISPADNNPKNQLTYEAFTCGSSFIINHIADSVAPVNKTVNYNTITNIPGELSKCWITSNLGADHQATALNDATEPSAGWYWQFNHKQGYKHDGTTRTPNTTWITSISENLDWMPANDPCVIELGLGWRIPTSVEWSNVDAAGNWTNYNGPWNSGLKIHSAGLINWSPGSLVYRGQIGYQWSSTQSTIDLGNYMDIGSGDCFLTTSSKAFGFSVRCIKDSQNPSLPTVTTTTPSNITTSTVTCGGNITSDGGALVTSRGVCWGTSENPSTSNSHTSDGSSTGAFVSSITGLTPNTLYHVRAFATNSAGTSYGTDLSFNTLALSCGSSFTINHVADTVAPVTKTVTYGTVTNIPGEITKCWITRNLGADQQATAVDDATELSAGWYWQFNRKQGYKHDGTTRTPATTWITSITEDSDWQSSNDPCSIELGVTWRIPTRTEWTNINANGSWANWNGPWGSGLKLHAAGYLNYSVGSLFSRGSLGYYWGNTQNSSDYSWGFYFGSTYSFVDYSIKGTAYTLRCLRDAGTAATLPSVNTFSVSNITQNSAVSGGYVSSDGGATVTTRGVCWSTSTNPTITNNHTSDGNGMGTFVSNITGLISNTIYHVRAFATNIFGTAYGNDMTFTTLSVFTCGTSITIDHVADTVAPVTKTVTYGTVSNIPGEISKCWITSNLGSDQQATAINDATEASAGWYWQFNHKRGFKFDGITRTPNTTWIGWFDENSDWQSSNDPCVIELGDGWHIPTSTEWTNVYSSGNWSLLNGPWNSALKIHAAGRLDYYSGTLLYRGINGDYWSSSQYNTSAGWHLGLYGGYGNVNYGDCKASGFSLRCVRGTGNVTTAPSVSTTVISNISQSTASCGGNVTSDGGTNVTARGVCWSTSSNPTTSNSHTSDGTGTGAFVSTLSGLTTNTMYHVRAYATNNVGTAYGTDLVFTTLAWSCGDTISIYRVADTVSPVTKTVTYHTVSNVPGEPTKCWITSNLGSDHQATTVNDATEASAGWYWQFNRKQGYKHDGDSRTPNTIWINPISENLDWQAANDACTLELGIGWRIPTYTEWNNVDASGNWTDWNGPWNSVLKIHAAGNLNGNNGSLNYRGSNGAYWSKTQTNADYGSYLAITSGICYINSIIKSPAFTLRCLKDAGSSSTTPTVSTTTVSNITQTTAASGGTVTSDGGAIVTARGVCWSASPDPTTSSAHTTDGSGSGTFVSSITGLTANTLYYVRAYATNSVGTAYGTGYPFTTAVAEAPPCPGIPIVTYEGKTYNTILISSQFGSQCWFKENLNVGTLVLGTSEQTNNGFIEKYCYNDLESYCNVYGGLYQWNEMMQYNTTAGTQGICPSGWHIPTDAEWTTLTTFLGGESVAGGPMKETGTSHWVAPNTGATNSSGFTALPGGKRYNDGGFNSLNNNAHFWTSTQVDATNSWQRYLEYGNTAVNRTNFYKVGGFSVRCLKNESVTSVIPVVTTTAISNITQNSATSGGDVTSDGGATVTARGVCWSTVESPTITDNHTTDGIGTGAFISDLTGLNINTLYHLRAYATNSVGTAYGSDITFTTLSGFSCGSALTITHLASGGVAPVDKTVDYGTVTSVPGETSKCWITRNLGASQQAIGVDYATEASAGWYWQFNRKQGYKHDGNTRTPNTTWTTSINENFDWQPANDPCSLELGGGWRIPTYTEWYSVDASGGWTDWNGPWNSVLKLHAAGYLNNTDGSLGYRGYAGYYWSSTQESTTTGWYLTFTSAISQMNSSGTDIKAYGRSMRCLKDNNNTTPTTQSTNVTFTNISSSQLTVNWTDGNGAKRAVFIKQGSDGSASPVNNIIYSANTGFGSGTQIETTGWYCIFNGTAHPSGVTVTNLLPNTNYRVMVCEYNGSAGSELYNISTATNNPNTLTEFSYPSGLQGYAYGTMAHLFWTAPISSAGITGYNLYRGATKLNSGQIAGLEYDDTGLANGTYFYTVKAVYGTTESAPAGPAQVVIGITNPAPVTIAATIGANFNSIVSVPVTLMGFNNITALSLRLEYDPNVLTWIGFSNPNTELTGLIINDIHVSATLHKIMFIWSDLTPRTIPNNGLMAYLNFTYVSGTTALTWNNTIVGGTECEYADAAGDPLTDVPTSQFYVNGETHHQEGYKVSGVCMYNNSANTPLDNVKVVLKQNATRIDSTTTSPSGYFEFHGVQKSIYVLEASSSKTWQSVNATDAIKVQRHFAGLELLTEPIRLLAADVNLSNSINATDAVKIKRRFSGLDDSFTRGDWVFGEPTTGGDTIIINASDVSQNFYGLCVGDVNGSNVPSAGKWFSPRVELADEGTIEVKPGQLFELPVKARNDMNVGAISLVIPYPEDLLEIQEVHFTQGVPVTNFLSGQVRIAWSELQPMNLMAGETLLTLKLRAKETFTGNQSIVLNPNRESELADELGEVIPLAELTSLTIKPLNPSGIHDYGELINSCKVYPNPARDFVSIELQLNSTADCGIAMLDLVGREVKVIPVQRFEKGNSKVIIQTKELVEGLYTIKLTLTSGGVQKQYLQKVVIGR